MTAMSELDIKKVETTLAAEDLGLFVYEYPMPAITVDIIYVVKQEILLIKRKNNPHKNKFAFPGGFLNIDETLEQAAIRELREETGIVENSLDFMMMADKINRDIRNRVISAVFLKRANKKPDTTKVDYQDETNDTTEMVWVDLGSIHTLELAFDHKEIFFKLYEKFA